MNVFNFRMPCPEKRNQSARPFQLQFEKAVFVVVVVVVVVFLNHTSKERLPDHS